jgi:hypothetical protein
MSFVLFASVLALIYIVISGLTEDHGFITDQDIEYRARAAREGWGFDSFAQP